MKFQKSFFTFDQSQRLVEECIYFFTKSIYPNGRSSRTLVASFSDFIVESIQAPRIIENWVLHDSILDLVNELEVAATFKAEFDFIIIDLRSYLKNTDDIRVFL